MNRCVTCKRSMACTREGVPYCPQACENIPEPIIDQDTLTYDSERTVPYHREEPACCGNPELSPFELRDGEFGQHCWSCGKVFK